MNKIGFVLCLLGFWSITLLAQQPAPTFASPQDSLVQDSLEKSRRVKILHADYLTFTKKEDEAIQKLIGKVRLQQDHPILHHNFDVIESLNQVFVFVKVGTIAVKEG